MTKIQELMGTAKICGEHLMNMIGNVLEINKAENGKIEIINSTAEIRMLISRTIQMCKVTMNKRRRADSTQGDTLDLKSIVEDTVPNIVECDIKKLTQVLINLTGNAIKFTKKGGVYIAASWIRYNNSDSNGELIKNALLQGSKKKILRMVENEFDEDKRELWGPYDLAHRRKGILIHHSRKSVVSH
jgi:hypothetical protein